MKPSGPKSVVNGFHMMIFWSFGTSIPILKCGLVIIGNAKSGGS